MALTLTPELREVWILAERGLGVWTPWKGRRPLPGCHTALTTTSRFRCHDRRVPVWKTTTPAEDTSVRHCSSYPVSGEATCLLVCVVWWCGVWCVVVCGVVNVGKRNFYYCYISSVATTNGCGGTAYCW